jgi:hypothetical protein
MRLKEETSTVVVVGHWNKYILSPGWLAKNIFNEPGLDVEVALNLNLPPRFTSPISHIRILPSEENITFVALENNNDCFSKMEALTSDLVNKLSYTPVKAFGINFVFTEELSKAGLGGLFDFSDSQALSSIGCQSTINTIRRRLIVENRILNLSITNKDNELFFEFNFHNDVTSTAEIIEKLRNKVVESKIVAERLLRDVYKLNYDPLMVDK